MDATHAAQPRGTGPGGWGLRGVEGTAGFQDSYPSPLKKIKALGYMHKRDKPQEFTVKHRK